MTDIVTMKIAVEAAEVRRATAETNLLGRAFTEAEREQLKMARALNTVRRDINLLGNAYGFATDNIRKMSRETSDWLRNQKRIMDLKEGSEKIARQQAAAEKELTQELIRQRDAAQKAATARASSYQTNLNANLGVGGPAATSGGAGFGALEAQMERLTDKFQPLRAASQLYEKELNDIKLAHTAGIISAGQYEKSVESLTLQYQQFQNQEAGIDNIFAQQAQGLGIAENRMNNFGVAAQQTGYQVSDFIVQVQSGTNPMVAFSQQATQLAGLLYLLPPATQAARIGLLGFSVSLGTAIAGFTILVPLLAMLAMNFIDFGNESDAASKKIDRQKQALDGLIEATERLRLQRQMQASGVQTEDEQVTVNAINDLLAQRVAIQERLKNLEFAIGNARGAALLQQKQAERDKIEADLAENQATLDQLRYQQELAIAERRRANERRNQYREELKSQQEANKLIAKMLLDMVKVSQVNIAKAFTDAKGPINTLIDKAGELYKKMVAIAYIDRNQVGGEDYVANQYRLYGQGQMDSRTTLLESNPLYTPFPVTEDEKTGGGGGKTKDNVEGLRSQYESLMGTFDPLIAAQNTYNQQLELLNTALQKNVISGKEYQAALALIKEQLEEAKDPLADFKKGLEDALDPEKNYMKGLQALQSSLAEFLFNPFEVGLEGMVLGFSRALQRMASEALAAGFMKMLLGGGGFGASGGIGSSILSFLSPNANGNAFAGGNVIPFANGGVVGGPMTFPMRGGKTGLMGEAGPEAIMPLKRGQDGKLGVASQGSASNNIKIVNVLDGAVVGNYLNTPEGEEVIMNVMRRTGVA